MITATPRTKPRKTELMFFKTVELRGCLVLFSASIGLRTWLRLICYVGVQLQMKIRKISCCFVEDG